MGRIGIAVVDGRSMLPTLRPGDWLLVRYGADPATGRLAVVRLPGRPLSVKRLGVSDADGWWVERDNPAEGVDSWSLGAPVAPDDVVAVVVARLWPRPGRLRRGPSATTAS